MGLRFLLVLCLFFAPTLSAESKGTEAIEKARREDKFLFLLLYKEQNDKTLQAQRTVAQAVQKLAPRVNSAAIKVKDPEEKKVVEQFGLKRSPMPFVLVIAPSGAVTGGFLSGVTEEQLTNSLVSAGAAKSLKGLQERKLVILLLQNSQTAHNEAALKGVKEFKADGRFGKATEVVMIDPSDSREQPFLKQLAIETDSTQATTVLLSPPGDVVGKYVGATSKERLVADLQKATSSSCCPGGCCPGGCCPGGCCR